VTGAGVGAALLFVFDPNQGTRRRAVIRDKVTRARRVATDAASTSARDMRNRAGGIVAAVRGRFRDEDVADGILCERVRAKIGRATAHARAIDVDARDGCVTLCGPVLASEVDQLLAVAGSVRGVHDIVNELEPHDTPAGIPSLQGEGRVAQPSPDILQHRCHQPRGCSWPQAPS
jgi:hypothetical protein